MTRIIAFDGIENFRDFGGYDTACGRGVKAGVLYRSANHAYATEADLKRLQEMGVKTIVDLRRRRERDREPSKRWDGFAEAVIENDLEGVEHDWAEALKASATVDAEWFRADSLDFYTRAPYAERHVELFRRYFRALAENDGAVVVHCAAGKDRTGFICALTHHIAGVHRDDTLADYLATNNEDRMAHRMGFLGPWVKDLTGITLDDAALRQAVSVHESFLERAFAEVAENHGTVDRYLEEVLEVDAGLRGKIEARILG